MSKFIKKKNRGSTDKSQYPFLDSRFAIKAKMVAGRMYEINIRGTQTASSSGRNHVSDRHYLAFAFLCRSCRVRPVTIQISKVIIACKFLQDQIKVKWAKLVFTDNFLICANGFSI